MPKFLKEPKYAAVLAQHNFDHRPTLRLARRWQRSAAIGSAVGKFHREKRSTSASDNDPLSDYYNSMIGVKMAKERKILNRVVPTTFTERPPRNPLHFVRAP